MREKLKGLVEKWRGENGNGHERKARNWHESECCAYDLLDDLEALLNAPSEAPAVTPPVKHEQVLKLADHIFSQKIEEQRQCFIDMFDLIDWQALASAVKPDVNSCGIWCPNCGAHLQGPPAPVLIEDQVRQALVIAGANMKECGHIKVLTGELNAILAQPAAPKEQP